jgi:23S rRNA pseudouridine2605 synthase
MLDRLKAGVMLEDGPAKFTDIQKAPGGEGFNHWYHCVVMEGRNREVRRLWESQGMVVSRLKRVRFGPVFLNSDLPMGRWREMTQGEIDILAAEVGLQPVALPTLNLKAKDKMERMQRKSSRPMGRGERVRNLRPASEGAAERPARQPRDSAGERPARQPRDTTGERPARQSRDDARKGNRGSAVAERPSEMRKRTAKPDGDKPAGRGRGKPRG